MYGIKQISLLPNSMGRRGHRRTILKYSRPQLFFRLLACICVGYFLRSTNTLVWMQRLTVHIGLEKSQAGGNLCGEICNVSAKVAGGTVASSANQSRANSIDGDPVSQAIEVPINKSDKIACHIPVLDPFDASVMPFFVMPEPLDCTEGHPLIFDTDLESNLIQLEDPADFGYQFCCYRKFSRDYGNNDAKITLDETCIQITEPKMTMPEATDFIIVYCQKNQVEMDNGTVLEISAMEPMDMFGFIHLKPAVEKRTEELSTVTHIENSPTEPIEVDGMKSQDATNDEGRKVNVVILGLDSVSHMNFKRVMPMTHEYITKYLSAHSLSGYTKVGLNTFPNLVPVLTGQNLQEIEQGCWKDQSEHFDGCPFIWKNYSSRGYRTAYGEDGVNIGNFNYAKPGFGEEPTDYYWNALSFQLADELRHQDLCLGPRLCIQVLLDSLKKMAFTMDKTRRYFQFAWTTQLSHEDFSGGVHGDKMLLETLQWFQNGGYFEDTIFILMSDHGTRYGDFRSTMQGRLEDRMPFLYFIFPKWFGERYESAVENLIQNEFRLTTPFDLHETLQDLLRLERLDRIQERYGNLDHELPRGISLFLPIPPRRTCQDAGINDHWCVCSSQNPIDLRNNSVVQEGARSMIHHINGMFVRFPQCVTLDLKEVLGAQVTQLDVSSLDLENDFTSITDVDDSRLAMQNFSFSILFQASPSDATFEVTTTRRTDGTWHILGEISRINSYGDDSECVDDYILKEYCLCR